MSDADEPFIRIRGLRQSFGTNEVLRGLDLDIHRGETLVILGSSGGGKSVLLKHLPGLLQPTGGSIRVDGMEISGLRERDMGPVRRQMAIMFQGGALFDSMTVAENVAFPLQESGVKDRQEIERRVKEALEIVRLPGQETKLPADLSGGMRKRVALARAVVNKPCCVLYDEPHAGLDPVTADSIDHLIKSLQRDHGMTNVVVTHELRSVFRIADRVVFLERGKIHWEGSAQELRDSDDPLLRAFIEGDSGDSWDE
ncbi:MAG: ATP-binding cassette domain-containing protein [Verrucomicrobiae bacterium]|nr:ATP-binding cassette domain-containing protein [Verrucomicrobiae bacterium]MCP5533936.1 ATP-binding cassette domain-containing protein [Akkermansiaceae bacterium]